ncbi:MAG: RDD family protein [Chloroflexi bacterium]|nr:MAG: RDD family protein [Chloroflexota bacterium]
MPAATPAADAVRRAAGAGLLLAAVGTIVNVIFHVNPNDPQSSGYAAASGINFVIGIAYFIGLWSFWGATFGQRIFKLRIVDANTMQPIGVGKAVLRYIGLFVAFLVCFVGVIWVAFDARKQGWQDKIAGTLVLQG